ncbi:Holliday junction branch migration protein RuvA [Candidatus Gracilibacteria bacterium]|nr:Holliday junction branch migration protein RuvA [Candidatus Gracilibacteria bacterium]MCF7898773.1 Holliday junction branch migration protein RuvA [Candidatus Paceibacterota bacterium]
MIGFLRGKAIIIKDSTVIIDVSGVGYKVLSPLPFILSTVVGQEVELYIHTHVREDQLTLFGFKDEGDLFLFEKLTSVSGIGPKSALSMLSIHSPSSIADAVERGDAEALSHTPGIGKRTAEKIIIELKGKISHLAGAKETDTTYEVRLALETLGYSGKEISVTIQKLSTEGKSTSALIKEALNQLQ